MIPVPIDKAIEIALAHQRAGQHARAEAIYRQILTVQPRNPDARYWLGILAATAGKTDLGIQLVREAIGIRGASADWLYNLGVALQMRGNFDEALGVYRESLRFKDDFLPTLLNLGTILSWRGEDEEAEQLFRKATVADPASPDGWTNLGNTLRRRHRLVEAGKCHEKAIALQPAFATAYNNLGSVLKELGRTHVAVNMFRKATELAPGDVRLWSNYLFALFYDPALDAKAIFDAHRAWGERVDAEVAGDTGARWFDQIDRTPGRRLRVGYVSGDFRDHSVHFFFEGLLAAHDPAAVEIFCYADGMQRDAVSERLKGCARQWRDIGPLNDQQLSALIAEDRIDILVDLAGHTAGNRMAVFAQRAAPVQVSYLGYLGTTGLRSIDYRVTDSHADPPGRTELLYAEKLWRLPRTFACYRPPPAAPPVSPSPFPENGHITFGSFNSLSKVNPQTVSTWAAILRQCAGSRLLMVAGGVEEAAIRETLLLAFQEAGVQRDRLELIGTLAFEPYLEMHARVDLVLDTFPVVGHTVTCHALWMGVPVVTLAGETYSGRLGVSVLEVVGLPELIAETQEAYIAAAVKLAKDGERLQHLRAGMRARLQRSALMDERGLAHDFEAAYRQMWIQCIAPDVAASPPSPHHF